MTSPNKKTEALEQKDRRKFLGECAVYLGGFYVLYRLGGIVIGDRFGESGKEKEPSQDYKNIALSELESKFRTEPSKPRTSLDDLSDADSRNTPGDKKFSPERCEWYKAKKILVPKNHDKVILAYINPNQFRVGIGLDSPIGSCDRNIYPCFAILEPEESKEFLISILNPDGVGIGITATYKPADNINDYCNSKYDGPKKRDLWMIEFENEILRAKEREKSGVNGTKGVLNHILDVFGFDEQKL